MKKNGFTLAEVLITLSIIGVVAAITLPSLMTNTAEQKAVTAYRKALNTLSEAPNLSAALDNLDYSTIGGVGQAGQVMDANGNPNNTLYGILASRTQLDKTKSLMERLHGGCGADPAFFFLDGTSFCVTDTTHITGNAVAYIPIIVDTNGFTGPNVLSTCNAAACARNARTIRDQFRATLYGASAVPGHITIGANGQITQDASGAGWAANWAMSGGN